MTGGTLALIIVQTAIDALTEQLTEMQATANGQPPLVRVTMAIRALELNDALADELRRVRDEGIRDAVATGDTTAKIKQHTGLSRSTVDKVRGKKRTT